MTTSSESADPGTKRYVHKPANLRADMLALNAAVEHLTQGGKLVVVLPQSDNCGVKSMLRARFAGHLRRVTWEYTNP